MQPALHRSRAPRLRRFPDCSALVGLRPLTRYELEAAAWAVDERWRAEGAPLGTGVHLLALRRAVLRLALCAPEPPHASLGAVDAEPQTIEALWELWSEVQAEHWPDLDRLDAETELQLAEAEADEALVHAAETSGYPPPPAHDTPLATEAAWASVAQSATDYYGAPITALTDAQIAYWLTLRAVHRRVNDPEGKDRCVSLDALRRRASGR